MGLLWSGSSRWADSFKCNDSNSLSWGSGLSRGSHSLNRFSGKQRKSFLEDLMKYFPLVSSRLFAFSYFRKVHRVCARRNQQVVCSSSSAASTSWYIRKIHPRRAIDSVQQESQDVIDKGGEFAKNHKSINGGWRLYDPMLEYNRMNLDWTKWRITALANKDYEVR